jgi:hypothetical protein
VLGLAGFGLTCTRAVAAPHWRVQRLPAPAGARQTQLSSVSCMTPTNCLGVGDSLVNGRERALAERWNGRAWAILPRPGDLENGALNAVDCTSWRSCVAVGERNLTANSAIRTRTQAVTEQWDGEGWSAQSTAIPARRTSTELGGVSCLSPSDCVAVGFSSRGYRTFPLVEHWNGSRWSLRQAPTAFDGTLDSVSCPSHVTCIAVGGWQLGTLRARWNGHHWLTRLGDETGGDALSALYSVSCSSSRACIAVGGEQSLGADEPIIKRWNGRRWSRGKTRPLGAILHGVSCPSARTCTAVGDSGLVIRWDGRRWSRPRPGRDVQFSGVSCISLWTCVAVGTNSDGTAPLSALDDARVDGSSHLRARGMTTQQHLRVRRNPK